MAACLCMRINAQQRTTKAPRPGVLVLGRWARAAARPAAGGGGLRRPAAMRGRPGLA